MEEKENIVDKVNGKRKDFEITHDDLLSIIEQLKKENADLKSAQNKVAIEKLKDVKYIIFDTPLDKKFYNYNPEKKSGAIFEEINTKLDTMIAELKGEKDE